MIAIGHMWLLNTWNMINATEEQNFFIFNLYVNSHMNESQPFYPDLWGLEELNPSYFSDFMYSNHCYPNFLAVPEQTKHLFTFAVLSAGMFFPLVFLYFLFLLKCYLARESFSEHSVKY